MTGVVQPDVRVLDVARKEASPGLVLFGACCMCVVALVLVLVLALVLVMSHPSISRQNIGCPNFGPGCNATPTHWILCCVVQVPELFVGSC